MVIETLIKPEWVEKNFWYALPLGFGLSIISIVVGFFIFPSEAALVGLLFTTLAALPFLRSVLYLEEVKDEKIHSIKKLILRNKQVLGIYFAFFLGIVLSYLVLFFVFPQSFVELLFRNQLSIFAFATAGAAEPSAALFTAIVLNNIKILIFALVLSFLYGAGAVMVLTWNASVFGIFLTQINSRAILFSIPHSLVEFSGFFLAAVAGGIISVAVEKDKIHSKKFKTILSDGLILYLVSVVIIVLAAAIEVTVGTMG